MTSPIPCDAKPKVEINGDKLHVCTSSSFGVLEL